MRTAPVVVVLLVGNAIRAGSGGCGRLVLHVDTYMPAVAGVLLEEAVVALRRRGALLRLHRHISGQRQ